MHRCLLGVLVAILALALAAPAPARAQRQMEALDRGVVAVNTGEGVFVSWRLLGTEPENLAFNVYRATGEGEPVRLNDRPLVGPTHFLDTDADLSQPNAWLVRAVQDGRELEPGAPFHLPADVPVRQHLTIPLRLPDGYHANDGAAGDLTGDGRYELVVKLQARAKDNSQRGETDPTILQAYTLEGDLLWAIDLGVNIRSGAHYTQMLVYDFDGDGRAEVVCKTADGTIDGEGRIIGDADADWRNERGYVLAGPEYLTVFDGLTGAALASTEYLPPRHPDTLTPTGDQLDALWGDGYGNRVDRFLAGVAYLDGERPSIVMARGYYTRAVIAAWDWRDSRLEHRWTFDSDASRQTRDYRGQGNHQLAVADVDGDGRDDIIYGAMVVRHDGTGLYTTGLGHGDALHVSDLDPRRPGLEVFTPHESIKSNGGIGTSFRDAGTGEILWTTPAEGDVGRGMAADIDPRHPGYELWATNSDRLYNARGEPIGPRPRSANSAIWWTGDLLRQLLDHRGERDHWHGVVYRWNPQAGEQEIIWEDPDTRSNNSTKGNPVLSADLFGDWREEMVWRTADDRELRVYTTTHPTEHRLPTLMHDPVYRLSVAWQNVAYNQPPHPGFFLGHGMSAPPRSEIVTANSSTDSSPIR